MRHSIDLLSSVYIDSNKIIKVIEQISHKMDLNIKKWDERTLDISQGEKVTLEIRFLEKEKFINLLKNDDYWGKEYGILFYIMVFGLNSEEDDFTIPFLKELLEGFPDFLLFNEEVKGGKPYVYSKVNLDNFTSDLFSENLQVPPKI